MRRLRLWGFTWVWGAKHRQTYLTPCANALARLFAPANAGWHPHKSLMFLPCIPVKPMRRFLTNVPELALTLTIDASRVLQNLQQKVKAACVCKHYGLLESYPTCHMIRIVSHSSLEHLKSVLWLRLATGIEVINYLLSFLSPLPTVAEKSHMTSGPIIFVIYTYSSYC